MFTLPLGTTHRSFLRRRRLVEYLHLILFLLRIPSLLLALYSFPSHSIYIPAFDPSTPHPVAWVPFLGVFGCLFALIGDASEFLVTCRFGTDENMFRYSLLSLYDEVAFPLYLVATLLVTSHQRAALHDGVTHDSLSDAKRRACLALLIANTTTRLFFVISPFIFYRVAVRTVRGFDEAFEERFGSRYPMY